MSAQPVPEQIRKVFGADSGSFLPEPGFSGRWRNGDVVCSRVDDATLATASARARERLEIPGVRIARPLRGTDGRHVVGGWRADRYPEAEAQARPDEIVALAGTLPAHLGTPLTQRRRTVSQWRPAEVFERALAAAWDGDPAHDLDAGLERHVAKNSAGFQADRAEALVAAAGMARLRDQSRRATASEIPAATGAAHLDIVRALRFSADGPVLTDVLLAAGPAVRGQAIAVVDLVACGVAGEELFWRWEALDDWPAQVASAMAYRLGVHALHPGSSPNAYSGLRSAAAAVERFVRAAHGV